MASNETTLEFYTLRFLLQYYCFNALLAPNYSEITEISRTAEEIFRHKHGPKTAINLPEFMYVLAQFTQTHPSVHKNLGLYQPSKS